ncbi:hypothetical protein GCM10020254_32450 [Streptomyces goshikiensis]
MYGLAELAREQGGLYAALRSETAVRAVESACRAPGASRAVGTAQVPDLLEFVDELERALRPLSLDWYEELGAVDVCHAAAGGVAALPGLLAKRFFGVPLLVTEYGVRLRAHYLEHSDGSRRPAVHALLAAFHTRLAGEIYAEADFLTPGNAHARRWQERCGARRDRLRTVHPGMEADRFATVGEAADCGDPDTLVWVGRVEPAKDLIALLHAFAEVRRAEPGTRLRIFATGAAPDYLADCRSLAAQLFPDEAADAVTAGENPVTFEEIGGPEVPSSADAYGAGRVVVLSSVVEGFPITLAEAMFCGRATVSTDAGGGLRGDRRDRARGAAAQPPGAGRRLPVAAARPGPGAAAGRGRAGAGAGAVHHRAERGRLPGDLPPAAGPGPRPAGRGRPVRPAARGAGSGPLDDTDVGAAAGPCGGGGRRRRACGHRAGRCGCGLGCRTGRCGRRCRTGRCGCRRGYRAGWCGRRCRTGRCGCRRGYRAGRCERRGWRTARWRGALAALRAGATAPPGPRGARRPPYERRGSGTRGPPAAARRGPRQSPAPPAPGALRAGR